MSTSELIGQRELAKEERRHRIVRAAREIIRETGDTDLSMRMIAKRADVSMATPYNLFGSKRAVVVAVLEDEQDFAERFKRLEAKNSIDHIFDAHTLAVSYYTEDPDFYRPLWKALLDTSGKNETGLVTPERLAQSRAVWCSMLEAAQNDGLLEQNISVGRLERTLSFLACGAMLSWAMESVETDALSASAGLGYALALRGVASPKGRALIDARINTFQKELDAVSRANEVAV